MQAIEEKIGYSFRDAELLTNALTHSSYANENRGRSCESNERLEFLGDSVLGLVVADALYRRFPGLPEGRMTRLRAQHVCEESLHHVHTGGRNRTSILADAVEALIAAMYLDGGMEVARGFIERYILTALDGEMPAVGDCKTELQELVQRKSGSVLTYELLGESGPDHDKTFTSQVSLNGRPIGSGSGRTKKEAEQAAARAALREMNR